MAKASDNAFPSILITEGTEPSAPAAGKQRLYIDSSTHKLKRTDSSGTDVTIEATAGALNKYDATAAPAVTDDSGDGYSVGSIWIDVTGDDAYICVDASVGAAVWNPFEAAGVGDPLYSYDTLFTGSSLPSGWAFTGSGTCVVSGNKATVTSGAHKDRLMYDFTPDGQYLIQMHVTNLSGTGGMPSLVVLDTNGDGWGTGPYNDSVTYTWVIDNYGYTGNTGGNSASPTLTDVWFQLYVVAGIVVAAGFSADGSTWTRLNCATTTSLTMTQFGICQIYTAASMVAEVVQVRYCAPV
jgi:hypothetical protein